MASVIRERRIARGLNMTDAARQANVGRSTWHALESGKRTTTLAGTLDRIDAVLGLTPGTLRAIRDERPLPASNVGALRHRLAAHAETMSPAQLVAALAWIESESDDTAPLRAVLSELDALRERVAATIGETP